MWRGKGMKSGTAVESAWITKATSRRNNRSGLHLTILGSDPVTETITALYDTYDAASSAVGALEAAGVPTPISASSPIMPETGTAQIGAAMQPRTRGGELEKAPQWEASAVYWPALA